MLIVSSVIGNLDNTNIKGEKNNNNEHKISLYADDIIIYLMVPEKGRGGIGSLLFNFKAWKIFKL